MNLAKTERSALCDLLDAVGPEAPTLCEGWDSHDLACHLWIRETDPLGAPGIMAKPLAGLTDRRMAETRQRWSYSELVDRVRRGPAPLSVFSIPGFDEAANAVEFFVHHEDVRRAQPVAQPPRALDDEAEDWFWRRMRLMARALFRSSPVGVVLERLGSGETLRAVPGQQTVTLVGKPSELLLYGQGRTTQAEVQVIGEDEAVERFLGTDLGI